MNTGSLKVLGSSRFGNAGSDDLSTTKTTVPTLDANGMGDDLFKKN